MSTKENAGKGVKELKEDQFRECMICAEEFNTTNRLTTVTTCGHAESICALCFFRIRSLQHNFGCPTCKQPLENVICVTDPLVQYSDFTIWADNIDGFHFDEASKMYFPSEYFQKVISRLRLYQCKLCPQTRRDFKQLKGHYHGEHNKHLCLLCHDNKQIFPGELVCYDQAAYERHIRQGDGDGSTGHPHCEFCRTRFYDSHALFIHLSREHETCHICEAQGIKYKYYHSYQHLETHFRKDHHICEEPSCLERRFVVFSNEFDYTAHVRQYHPHLANLSRAVNIRFNYKAGSAPSESKREERNNNNNNNNPDYISRTARYEGGMGGRAQDGEWQVEIQVQSIDPRDPNRNITRETTTSVASPAEDFPTLASASTGGSLGSYKWSNARGDGVNQMNRRKNDFPALPSAPPPTRPALVVGKARTNIPQSRSAGELSSKVAAGGGGGKANGVGKARAAPAAEPALSAAEEAWMHSNPGNFGYEYDLAAAISASLADAPRAASAPVIRPVAAEVPKKGNALEEAFPALGIASSTAESKPAAAKVPPKKAKPAGLSNDLRDALKMIGADNKVKKKKSSGLTVVSTLKQPATAANSTDSSNNRAVNPPAPPALNAQAASFKPLTIQSSNIEQKYGGWEKEKTLGGAERPPPAPAAAKSQQSKISEDDFPSLSGRRS